MKTLYAMIGHAKSRTKVLFNSFGESRRFAQGAVANDAAAPDGCRDKQNDGPCGQRPVAVPDKAGILDAKIECEVCDQKQGKQGSERSSQNSPTGYIN